MKIGLIGVGMVGGPLSELWASAGHEVFVSSRHPARLQVPPGGRKGSVLDAVRFADVLLLAIPLSAVPGLPDEVKRAMAGKVLLDANNAWKGREGDAAAEVHGTGLGSGTWTARQLPGARVVKAFNTWPFFQYATYAALPPAARPAVPLASDDSEALALASELVRDARMEPVVAFGGLRAAARFDTDTTAGPLSMLTKNALVEALAAGADAELR